MVAAPREKLPRFAVTGMTTLPPGAALAEPTCSTTVFGSGVLVEVRVGVDVGVEVKPLVGVDEGVSVEVSVAAGVGVSVEVAVGVGVASIMISPLSSVTGIAVPEGSVTVSATRVSGVVSPAAPTAWKVMSARDTSPDTPANETTLKRTMSGFTPSWS